MTYESRFHNEEPNRCIVRLSFNSEHEVRKAGFVYYSDGSDEFQRGKWTVENSKAGSPLSYIQTHNFYKLSEGFSVRIKFRINSVDDGTTEYILSGHPSPFQYNLNLGAVAGSKFAYSRYDTVYLNTTEIATNSVTPELNTDYEIVLIEEDAPSGYDTGFVLGCYGDTYRLGADIEFELFEIYNYALTEEEVKNLYENKTYKQLTLPSPILDISAQSGSIVDRFGASLTLTDMSVRKEGLANVMDFTTNDGILTTTDINPFLTDQPLTVVGWVKLDSKYVLNKLFSFKEDGSRPVFNWNHTGNKPLWNVGAAGPDNYAYFSSSAIDLVENNHWFMYALYIPGNQPGDSDNAKLYLNGTKIENIGGSDGEYTEVPDGIGLGNAGLYSSDIAVGSFRIWNQELSQQQVYQLYSSERKKYNV